MKVPVKHQTIWYRRALAKEGVLQLCYKVVYTSETHRDLSCRLMVYIYFPEPFAVSLLAFARYGVYLLATRALEFLAHHLWL